MNSDKTEHLSLSVAFNVWSMGQISQTRWSAIDFCLHTSSCRVFGHFQATTLCRWVDAHQQSRFWFHDQRECHEDDIVALMQFYQNLYTVIKLSNPLTLVVIMPQGYAYILTHPGQPAVFYDHFFDWGESIRNAILDLVWILLYNWSKNMSCNFVEVEVFQIFTFSFNSSDLMRWLLSTDCHPKTKRSA